MMTGGLIAEVQKLKDMGYHSGYGFHAGTWI